VVKWWNKKHKLVDRNLLVIQAQLDELAKERPTVTFPTSKTGMR